MPDGCGNGSGAWFAIVGVGAPDDPRAGNARLYAAFSATASKSTKKFANPLDLNPQSCYYGSTSFAGLFYMPFFKGACNREGGLLTDNGGAEQ